MRAAGYRELTVWQRAMDLVEHVYASTRGFPPEELYALASQMRRAAVSVPSNIAEGQGRGGRDFRRFVRIAYGSLLELETCIELACRLGYLGNQKETDLLGRTAEVGRMLNGLMSSLRSERPRPPEASK